MPILDPIEPRNEAYQSFSESGRWRVTAEDGVVLGEVWRATDHLKRKTWLFHPVDFPRALIDRHVVSGYSKTSKRGCVEQLEEWRACLPFRVQVDDVEFHCAHRWVSQQGPEHENRLYWALGDAGQVLESLWVRYNEHPRIGDKPGWQVAGMRGRRSLYIQQCETLEEGLSLYLEHKRAPANEEDLRYGRLSHPPPIHVTGSKAELEAKTGFRI